MFCFQRNDLKIDWKELKFGFTEETKYFYTASDVKESISNDVFKPGFRPSMSFRTSSSGPYLYRQTFVSQKQVIGSKDYEREYISLRFKGIHDITDDTKADSNRNHELLWNVTETSKCEHLMLGSIGYSKLNETQSKGFRVFFQVDDVIEYCWKDASEGSVLNLDKEVYVFPTIH